MRVKAYMAAYYLAQAVYQSYMSLFYRARGLDAVGLGALCALAAAASIPGQLLFGAAADYAWEAYGLIPVFLPIERRLDVSAARLAARDMKAPYHILEDTGRSDHTIGLFARMQAVVSMRLHALVFSAGQGVPLVGVVYDQKISSFLSYIGQDLFTDLGELTYERLTGQIDAAVRRIGDVQFLSGGVERLRQVERRNSETAAKLLGLAPPKP